MPQTIATYQGGVTLLGGGAVAPEDLHHALARAPALVAADGGADRALALGLMPDLVIGDMDSLSPAAQARLGDRLHRVAEQDSTDFGKCLSHVSARFYLGLGFTGLRLDHTLAALSEIAQRPAQPVILLAEDELILRAPRRFAVKLPPGERFSIFPFGAVQGTSEGLRWPIDGLLLTPEGRVGTSNAVTGPVRLCFDDAVSGAALLLYPKRHLDVTLAALGLRH